MIKNLIENAKLTAQKVISKETPKQTYEQFPTFDQLALKMYSLPKGDLWSFSVEDLSRIISQMDDYINRLHQAYIDVCDQFSPIFNKFEMMEKERKRICIELQEKDSHCKELEQAMIEMQVDADNELRKKEIIEGELEQKNKELQSLQSQIHWNQQIDDPEEFNAELVELDKSNDEQFKQRIDALQKEIQEYISLNKDQLLKIQLQGQEIEKQCQENKQINRNLNMVLQQLADQQSKNRQESESRQSQINVLIKENSKLIQQLQILDQERTQELQIKLENNKLKEEIKEMKMNYDQLNQELSNLTQQVQVEQQKQKELNSIIQMLKNKRDMAINEITLIQQNKPNQDSSYTISVQKLKQIRFQIQSKLISMRKEFEYMYKQYLMLICQLEKNNVTQDLMKLEKQINKIVLDMQNLVDEVEDVME